MNDIICIAFNVGLNTNKYYNNFDIFLFAMTILFDNIFMHFALFKYYNNFDIFYVCNGNFVRNIFHVQFALFK